MKFTDEENEICINPDDISGYVVQRSPTCNFLFNVFGVDAKGNWLFCAASDLDFEKATSYVTALNEAFYPVIPTPTELAFVEVGGESKVYNITKG